MLKIGDKVEYSYNHHLNRKSTTTVTKTGIIKYFVGYGKDYNPNNLFGDDKALVHFKGNKNPTRIEIKKLTKC